MNVIEKAKELKEIFDTTSDEYAESNNLVDSGEWYDLSGRQDEVISDLLAIVEAQEWNPNMDDMAFIKRWVQRVHDKETTLEEFYGVLRYYEPLKPITEEANDK